MALESLDKPTLTPTETLRISISNGAFAEKVAERLVIRYGKHKGNVTRARIHTEHPWLIRSLLSAVVAGLTSLAIINPQDQPPIPTPNRTIFADGGDTTGPVNTDPDKLWPTSTPNPLPPEDKSKPPKAVFGPNDAPPECFTIPDCTNPATR